MEGGSIHVLGSTDNALQTNASTPMKLEAMAGNNRPRRTLVATQEPHAAWNIHAAQGHVSWKKVMEQNEKSI